MNDATGGYYDFSFVHLIACCNRTVYKISSIDANELPPKCSGAFLEADGENTKRPKRARKLLVDIKHCASIIIHGDC
jgi:hypothetical protein